MNGKVSPSCSGLFCLSRWFFLTEDPGSQISSKELAFLEVHLEHWKIVMTRQPMLLRKTPRRTTRQAFRPSLNQHDQRLLASDMVGPMIVGVVRSIHPKSLKR